MVLSRDWDIQREQRILSAIRDSLFADPRTPRLGGHPSEDSKLIKQQATVEGEGITSDSPSTAPSKPTDKIGAMSPPR